MSKNGKKMLFARSETGRDNLNTYVMDVSSLNLGPENYKGIPATPVPANPVLVTDFNDGNRITSYNVCYTKLLRPAGEGKAYGKRSKKGGGGRFDTNHRTPTHPYRVTKSKINASWPKSATFMGRTASTLTYC